MKESGLESDILQYLNYMGGMFFRTHDAKHKPATPGVPDIVGVKAGKFYAFEVKRPGCKTSGVQDDFLFRLKRFGARAHIVTSLADVQEVMK